MATSGDGGGGGSTGNGHGVPVSASGLTAASTVTGGPLGHAGYTSMGNAGMSGIPGTPGHPGHENAENNAVSVPTRHPKPLTAGELCLQMEQEQEAVVNRLTRELSSLRARSGSIASATSVSSTLTSGPSHSIPASASAIAGGNGNGSASVSERRNSGQVSLSRRDSTTSSRLSVPPSPLPLSAAFPSHTTIDHSATSNTARHASLPTSQHPHHHSPSGSSVSLSASQTMQPRSYSISSSRYEEAATHRLELEAAKHENMILLRRIRELEQQLRDRRRQSHEQSLLQGHDSESYQDLHRRESESGGVALPR